jgi:predicted flap endonuclease-1-like 5' DNA nuclease
MPKPSDIPPRAVPSADELKRFILIEKQLAEVKTTAIRQRTEIEELRGRLDADETRIGELGTVFSGTALPGAGAKEELERRFAELENERDFMIQDLTRRFDRPDATERLDRIERRLAALEEGTELSRVRMRLERMGHRFEDVERRVVALDDAQRALHDALERREQKDKQGDEKIARIESLFSELTDELRADREAVDLDGVRARLDDVEKLVLRTGSDEQALHDKLSKQERAIAMLREGFAAPARASALAGDDLTRIKGIGPKFARLLNEIGITTFAQVAAWTDEDVELVAAELGIASSRIRKSGWIEAAARLVR